MKYVIQNNILKNIDLEKNKKTMDTTKKNMDKFILTEQNRHTLEEKEKEKIDEILIIILWIN